MSRKKLINKQEELQALQEERKKLIVPFLKENDLIEGSYMEVLQKCGRPTCQCVKKPIHLVSRLSKWVAGKLKHKVVKIEDRQQVSKLVEIYKEHKNSMSELTKNLEKERKIMNSIIKLKNKSYE
jgi:hypothetical protein